MLCKLLSGLQVLVQFIAKPAFALLLLHSNNKFCLLPNISMIYFVIHVLTGLQSKRCPSRFKCMCAALTLTCIGLVL